MEKVREYSKNPLYVGIAAGVLGLIVGWFVIGWALWPVTYYDAAPVNLRADLQVDYLRMAIDSYSKNGDVSAAKLRYQNLGPDASKVLAEIRTSPGKTFPDDITKFSNALALTIAQPGQGTLAPTLPVGTAIAGTAKPVATALPGAVTTPTAPAAENNSGTLLIILCIVLLVIGAALAYVFLLRNRKGGNPLAGVFSGGKPVPAPAQPAEYQAPGVEAPIAQFMTT
jgi:hypothetical protein